MNTRISTSDRINTKINSWTLISYDPSSRKYKGTCDCGYESNKSLCNFKVSISCQKCKFKAKALQYVGKTFGKLKIVDCVYLEGKNLLKAICLCKNEILIDQHRVHTQNGCFKCSKGLYPGVIVDGLEILEYLGARLYKIKCTCGTVFEDIPRKYNGKYIGCGCHKRNSILEKAKEHLGKTYENIRVTKVLGFLEGHVIFEVKCKCGNTILRKNGQLFKSKSCGCLNHKYLPKNEKAKNSKLKNVEILAMRELYDSGQYTIQKLMEMYDLPYSYVWKIVKRKIWKNI